MSPHDTSKVSSLGIKYENIYDIISNCDDNDRPESFRRGIDLYNTFEEAISIVNQVLNEIKIEEQVESPVMQSSNKFKKKLTRRFSTIFNLDKLSKGKQNKN